MWLGHTGTIQILENVRRGGGGDCVCVCVCVYVCVRKERGGQEPGMTRTNSSKVTLTERATGKEETWIPRSSQPSNRDY